MIRDAVAESFRGAGASGAVYCGAIGPLERLGFAPVLHAGTSAGAIMACLRGIGAGTYEIVDMLREAPLAHFSRDTWMPGPLELLLDAGRLVVKGGLNAGWGLQKWLDNLFGNQTFGSVYRKRAHTIEVWAWDIERRAAEKFNWRTAGEVRLSQAVGLSVRIPIYYTPGSLNGVRYWDGGLAKNDPLASLRDAGLKANEVIGFRVGKRRPDEREPDRRFGLRSAADAIGKALTDSHEIADWLSLSDEWHARSILIDRLGVGSTDWGALQDPVKLAALIASGENAAREWATAQGEAVS